MAAPEDNVEKGLFEQDPHVDQLRPEPSAPPSDVVILEGLAGKSDREGWARLYFNRELTYYAEFRKEDIVFTEAVSPDQSPMVGLKATRVGIKKDAIIEYTRTTRAKAGDEFDLDVRLSAGPPQTAQPNLPRTPLDCPGDTGRPCITDTCRRTCDTCPTNCQQRTCDTGLTHCVGQTCYTRCNQPTCRPTCNTCQTECNPCNTCVTHCDQNTCRNTDIRCIPLTPGCPL